MKRFLVAVLVTSMLMVAAPTRAQLPHAGSQHVAIMMFVQQEDDGVWFYFVLGGHWVTDFLAPEFTFGVVGRGKCRIHKNRMMCRASGKLRRLPMDAYEYDPTLARAELTMKAQGHRHHVVWTGIGPVRNWHAADATEEGPQFELGAGQTRDAVADGELYGHSVVQEEMAMLAHGAMAYRYVDADPRIKDGRMYLRLELPIRHARWVR